MLLLDVKVDVFVFDMLLLFVIYKNYSCVASRVKKETCVNLKLISAKNVKFSSYLLPILLGIECSTFYKCRVAKVSLGLIPPPFVITIIMFMNVAKVTKKYKKEIFSKF